MFFSSFSERPAVGSLVIFKTAKKKQLLRYILLTSDVSLLTQVKMCHFLTLSFSLVGPKLKQTSWC